MICIALIGASGSIGRQVKDIVRRYPDRFCIKAMTVNTSVDSLKADSKEFCPEMVGVSDETAALSTEGFFRGKCQFVGGTDANIAAATHPNVDIVLVSVVGMVGLRAVVAALTSGKKLALANKESLVTGGELVMRLAAQKGIMVMPVDSEHSAVFQCLHAGQKKDVKRIILTASGGPFRALSAAQLDTVTPEQALKHPTWNMGAKITIDSATLMNKGLEIIEARWLFETRNIEAVVQPQSIIHSMVEFCDNSVVAQMSYPTMELPIQLALTYPERLPSVVQPLDFSKLGAITFEALDTVRFPSVRLAYLAMEEGGLAPTVLNAANEAAVALFLQRRIKFTDIPKIIEQSLDTQERSRSVTVDDIYALDTEVKTKVNRTYGGQLK